jgi:endonuclease/exonuclease/phosphatase (EEP) superfamily protein YafD
MARAARTSLLILGWFILAVTGVMLAVREIGVTQITAVAVVSGMPFAAIAAATAALFFAVARSRVCFLLALVATVMLAAVQLPRFVADERTASGPVVTVLTVNVAHGDADAAAIVEQVERSDADVLAVQELTAEEERDLTAAGIEKSLPYSFTAALPVADGTGLWSRTPLTDGTRLDGYGFVPVQADTTIDGVDLTLVSFHAMSPATPRHTVKWAEDLKNMRARMDGYTRPAIVAGDFNATWDHRPFRELATEGFGDAAGMAGAGLFLTFPAERPLAQLDHVVVTEGIDALGVAPVPIIDSDHLAVTATLQLPVA